MKGLETKLHWMSCICNLNFSFKAFGKPFTDFKSLQTVLHGIVRILLSFCETIDCMLQLGRVDIMPAVGNEEKDLASFSPSQPREKWIKKRTSVKLKVQHIRVTTNEGKL